MANPYVNKVIVNGQTRLDLTGDTVDAAHLLSGRTAHDRSGAPVTGECTFDADTTDANAAAGDILSGKTAYVQGEKVTGTMANNGGTTGSITSKAQTVSIPAGYQDGSGSVGIAAAEQAKIIPANIVHGITILGVQGEAEAGSTEPVEPDAGDTPVYADITAHTDRTVNGTTCYEYTAKKDGTYRIRCHVVASDRRCSAAVVRTREGEGSNIITATFGSTTLDVTMQDDVELIAGDVITAHIAGGSLARSITAYGMEVSVDWSHGLL